MQIQARRLHLVAVPAKRREAGTLGTAASIGRAWLVWEVAVVAGTVLSMTAVALVRTAVETLCETLSARRAQKRLERSRLQLVTKNGRTERTAPVVSRDFVAREQAAIEMSRQA